MRLDSEQQAAYFDYLTTRLESGESNNIVIPTTAEVISNKLQRHEIVRVADVGSFSGAMLNRIGNEVGIENRNRLRLVGLDCEREVMKLGSQRYPDITFVEADLRQDLPLVEQYHVVVLSNVLHEVISGDNFESNHRDIYPVFARVANLLADEGTIIILDGVRPPQAEQSIQIDLQSSQQADKYLKFAQRYEATCIVAEQNGASSMRTTTGSLAAFMTKARYMDKQYWPNESSQLYQYFSEGDFREMLEVHGLHIDKSEPQRFTLEEIAKVLKKVEPEIEFPAKNILITASR